MAEGGASRGRPGSCGVPQSLPLPLCVLLLLLDSHENTVTGRSPERRSLLTRAADHGVTHLHSRRRMQARSANRRGLRYQFERQNRGEPEVSLYC
jgi:hypothetical protein